MVHVVVLKYRLGWHTLRNDIYLTRGTDIRGMCGPSESPPVPWWKKPETLVAPVQMAWITHRKTFSFWAGLPDSQEMRRVGQDKETAAILVSQGLLWTCVKNGMLSSARDGKNDNSCGPQSLFPSLSSQHRHFVDVLSRYAQGEV